MNWYRAYHGMPFDPKFRVIAKKAGCSISDVLGVWLILLDRASQAEDRGSVAGYDVETIAVALDVTDETVCNVTSAFQGRLIDEDDRIIGWEKRQPKREREADSSTERVRKYRENKKKEAERDGVTEDETPCNAMKRQETPRGEERRGEENKKETNDAGAFAFAGNVIRLKQDQFDRWKSTYHAIPDMRSELQSLDDWLHGNLAPQDRAKWFHRASGALRKAHQRYLADAPKKQGGFIRGFNPGD